MFLLSIKVESVPLAKTSGDFGVENVGSPGRFPADPGVESGHRGTEACCGVSRREVWRAPPGHPQVRVGGKRECGSLWPPEPPATCQEHSSPILTRTGVQSSCSEATRAGLRVEVEESQRPDGVAGPWQGGRTQAAWPDPGRVAGTQTRAQGRHPEEPSGGAASPRVETESSESVAGC